MRGTPDVSQATTNGATASPWRGLCTAGGNAALVASLGFRRNIGAEYMLLRSLGIFQAGPAAEPVTAAGWFDLFQSNPLVALTLYGVFDLLNYALVALIYLGLYAALRRVNRGAMVAAPACCLWSGAACPASTSIAGTPWWAAAS